MRELWYPPMELIENSNVKRFMDKYGFKDYRELVKKSVDDIEWFWRVAAEELGVHWFEPYKQILDTSEGVEWAKWFIGGKMNIAYNALDRHAESRERNRVAFIWKGEDGEVKKYTYRDLYVEANRLANALKELGVEKGDRVALLLPMIPETVVSLYAALKIGAIVLPIFTGFGSSAIATRLEHSGAKLLITVDGTYRRGRIIKVKEIADESLSMVKNDIKTIVVNRMGIDFPWVEGRDYSWGEVCKRQSNKCDSLPVDSEHPALLLYTSGTTGRPKGAVISHIGGLLQPSRDIYFNLDLKPEDVFMWITDIGWMMGPWQIIGVQNLCGTHVIFEGAINYPAPDRIWSLIEEFGITHLGGSATVFRMLKGYGDEWIDKHDISTLRMTGNTGEPLDPDTWQWLLEKVGRGVCPVINLTGGTELFGCLVLPLPIMPLKPSTVGLPALGMDVDVFDDDGRPVRGEVGYLVCKKPGPSMTRGFWGEPERYIETYWSRWPGVWYHGDWASIDEDGFWYLHGRADDVIKIAGKRLGPAEVESIIDEVEGVKESACIGVPDEVKGEAIVCFVTLKEGVEPNEELVRRIHERVVHELGKPFAPKDIIIVRDLPRNRAGKIMRRMIRAVMAGQEIGDISIVENPESLREIEEAVKGK